MLSDVLGVFKCTPLVYNILVPLRAAGASSIGLHSERLY